MTPLEQAQAELNDYRARIDEYARQMAEYRLEMAKFYDIPAQGDVGGECRRVEKPRD